MGTLQDGRKSLCYCSGMLLLLDGYLAEALVESTYNRCSSPRYISPNKFENRDSVTSTTFTLCFSSRLFARIM